MLYEWKELFKNEYQVVVSSKCSVHFTKDLDFSFIKSFVDDNFYSDLIKFKSQYSQFSISKQSQKAIDDFSLEHNLNKNDLYGLSTAFQSIYTELRLNRITDPENWEDAYNYYEQTELFLSVIEKYLNKEPSSEMVLKMKAFEKTFEIKNFLVINDWFKAYIQCHNLTLENFNKFKINKLSEINIVKLDKFPEYFLQNSIKAIFNFISLKSLKLTKNSKVKHTTFFLLVSQIPINSKADEIPIPSSFTDMSSSDVNNTNTYRKGLKVLTII